MEWGRIWEMSYRNKESSLSGSRRSVITITADNGEAERP